MKRLELSEIPVEILEKTIKRWQKYLKENRVIWTTCAFCHYIYTLGNNRSGFPICKVCPLPKTIFRPDIYSNEEFPFCNCGWPNKSALSPKCNYGNCRYTWKMAAKKFIKLLQEVVESKTERTVITGDLMIHWFEPGWFKPGTFEGFHNRLHDNISKEEMIEIITQWMMDDYQKKNVVQFTWTPKLNSEGEM